MKAVVVGSGPNGLGAAITLARAGVSVEVREAAPTAGGGMRSEELTLPGFIHDSCSAAHPMGAASPLFNSLPLGKNGLRWIRSPATLAHPLDDGRCVTLFPSVEQTAAGLEEDGPAYRSLFTPLVRDWKALMDEILGPVLHLPRHWRELPTLIRFGLEALTSAEGLARRKFRGPRARALFAGIAAHAATPLGWAGTSAIGLPLAVLGHATGWPIATGGSGQIARALIACLESLGGRVVTGAPVRSLDELPPTELILLDLTPRQVLKLAGHRFPARYQRLLQRYHYGPGVYKIDWALSGPIPWIAPECSSAATIHLGGTMEELVESERRPVIGELSSKPYVLLTQPSLFDPSRAPPGQHTAWAYCHVPNGWPGEFTSEAPSQLEERMENQIERFAPGFRALILAKHGRGPAQLESRNANLVGGDISGGLTSLAQLLARPSLRPNPYATPARGIYLCSASTPPGPAVHGMCGYWAARAALAERGIRCQNFISGT